MQAFTENRPLESQASETRSPVSARVAQCAGCPERGWSEDGMAIAGLVGARHGQSEPGPAS
jgi:hypothetical protein